MKWLKRCAVQQHQINDKIFAAHLHVPLLEGSIILHPGASPNTFILKYKSDDDYLYLLEKIGNWMVVKDAYRAQ